MDGIAAVTDYLYGLRNRGSKYGIDRMRSFEDALGHPEGAYPIIHVAGTNGKGSTCAMLEAICRSGGLKTGLFVSPHLVYLGERVQVNRENIEASALCAYIDELRPIAEGVAGGEFENHPTFFEFMVAVALIHFAESAVDVGIFETGLGGRLDATNVVTPELSVITSISFDHMEHLGSRLEDIAGEKAGIVKAGRPVVLGLMPEAAEETIRKVAEERGSVVYSVRESFADQPLPETNLHGEYQRRNAATAQLAMSVLGECWGKQWDFTAALAKVSWEGRWERIQLGEKEIILDATHNPEGCVVLEENLKELVQEKGKKPIVVVGVLGEERAKVLMPLVARFASRIFLLVPKQPRAVGFEKLEALIPDTFSGSVNRSMVGELFPDVSNCVVGEKGETVVVTGSIYLIGEVLEAVRGEDTVFAEFGSVLQDKI